MTEISKILEHSQCADQVYLVDVVGVSVELCPGARLMHSRVQFEGLYSEVERHTCRRFHCVTKEQLSGVLG